jgi:SOS-response transcriptional repressor LexA
MMEMTPAQRRLWTYIKGCKECPSFDEMTDAMGLHSKSGIFRLIEALEHKGYIHCARRGGLRVHRGITINAKPRPDLSGYKTDELADEINRRLAA